MTIYSKNNPPVGFYVYAYLRSRDSIIARTGTPYYIGKGSELRAWSKIHSVSLPTDHSNIIILEQNRVHLRLNVE